MTSPANGSREEGFLRTLSGTPERRWPDGAVHHGVRVLLLLLVASILTAFFPPRIRMEVATYETDEVAEEDVIARIGFTVPKDPDELERERAEAARAIPPTFDNHPEAADSMEAGVERFFERVDTAAERSGVDAVRNVLQEYGIQTSRDEAALLTDPATRAPIRAAAIRATRQILPRGVVDATQAQLIVPNQGVIVRTDEEERTVDEDEILTLSQLFQEAEDYLPASASPDAAQVLRLVLIHFVEYTYRLNVLLTEQDRDAARQSVPTIEARVVAGEAIVRANQRIDALTLKKLNAHERALRDAGMIEEARVVIWPFVGATLLNVVLLGVFGLLLYFFRGEIYGNFRWILLLAVLVTAYFGTGAVVASERWPQELLPIAFVALAVAILWDGRMALALALLLAILTGAQPPFQRYDVVLLVAVGGAAAALSVRAMRRRAQVWGFIAIITAAYLAVIVATAMIQGEVDPGDLAMRGVWVASNATFSAILAMGFIPVFEWFTGITTDQTLLEWADPNRPLLKRLSLEAPGTYAHTINVANLAESAANAIGANGLLCRAGLYYHDVGKMLKPQYFVENQPEGRNPHDKLKPDTSAAIVREHVIEGLRLAREENVPEIIAAFIPEHHGTQRIGFFWEKAKEEFGEEALDPEQFHYPGPRPQTKETAIAMLSDSVESATRVLQDPSPERIRDLIDSILEGKIQQGQLDDAPLTLKEIATLREQFVKVLSGMYHHRVEYPETKHLTDADEPGPGDAGPGGPEGGGSEEEEEEEDEAGTAAPLEDRTAADAAAEVEAADEEEPDDEAETAETEETAEEAADEESADDPAAELPARGPGSEPSGSRRS